MELHLASLDEGSMLAASFAAVLYDAARVALDRYHTSPANFSIHDADRDDADEALGRWRKPGERESRSFAHQDQRTERAAECLALSALRARDGLVVLYQATRKSGHDWRVGPRASARDDEMIAVEVSGIDRPRRPAVVAARLSSKVRQIRKGIEAGRCRHPGIAVVASVYDREVHSQHVELPRSAP